MSSRNGSSEPDDVRRFHDEDILEASPLEESCDGRSDRSGRNEDIEKQGGAAGKQSFESTSKTTAHPSNQCASDISGDTAIPHATDAVQGTADPVKYSPAKPQDIVDLTGDDDEHDIAKSPGLEGAEELLVKDEEESEEEEDEEDEENNSNEGGNSKKPQPEVKDELRHSEHAAWTVLLSSDEEGEPIDLTGAGPWEPPREWPTRRFAAFTHRQESQPPEVIDLSNTNDQDPDGRLEPRVNTEEAQANHARHLAQQMQMRILQEGSTRLPGDLFTSQPRPHPQRSRTPRPGTKVPGTNIELSDGEESYDMTRSKFEKLSKKRKRTDDEEIEYKRVRTLLEQRDRAHKEVRNPRAQSEDASDKDTETRTVVTTSTDNEDWEDWDRPATQAVQHRERALANRRGATAQNERMSTQKKVKSNLMQKKLREMKQEANKRSKKGKNQAQNQENAASNNKKKSKKQDVHLKVSKKEEKQNQNFLELLDRLDDEESDYNGEYDSRRDTLNGLLADIPASDRRAAKNHAEQLRKAYRAFGRNFVQPDAEAGYWNVRGLTTRLRHHQLIGSGWMLDRENGINKPHGGLLCDDMGFGKTLQAIALMLAAPADAKKTQATLVVAPGPVVDEWLDQITKHVDERFRGNVILYTRSSKPRGLGIPEMLENCFCVITTYADVASSLDGSDCPNELVTADQVRKWYEGKDNAKVGDLHKVKWHRIILDEAHTIKNYKTIQARACQFLEADRRWCLTGSPLVNDILETFSYLVFLRIPIVGSREQFVANFKGDEQHMQRMQELLSAIMLRRNHKETFMKRRIVSLPKHTRGVTEIDFSRTERAIYDIFKDRMATEINSQLDKKHRKSVIYQNVLKLMTHLRQLTAHFLLGAETLCNLLTHSDRQQIERIINEDNDQGSHHYLKSLREILSRANAAHFGGTATSILNMHNGDLFGHHQPNGKEILDQIDSLRNADEGRTLCGICESLLVDPVVKTSCGHYFCQDCLEHHVEVASLDMQTQIVCPEPACSEVFEHSEIVKVNWKTPRQKKKEQREYRENKDKSWVLSGDCLLASSKLIAVKAQVQEWFHESDIARAEAMVAARTQPNKEIPPPVKIIIYTQWIAICNCLERICKEEGWGSALFNGQFPNDVRDEAKRRFIREPDCRILIATLKTGSTGLNLTAATRIINIDPWWNYAVEAQAYARIWRLGQTQETKVQRFIVRGTIDQYLLKMQERKMADINKVLREGGDDGETREGSLTLPELLSLFGTVEKDDQGKMQIVKDPFTMPDHERLARWDLGGVYNGGERGVKVHMEMKVTPQYRPFEISDDDEDEEGDFPDYE